MKKLFFLLIILSFSLENFAQTCLSGDCQNGVGKMEYKTDDINFIYEGSFKEGALTKGLLTFSKPFPKFNVNDEYYLRLLKFEGTFKGNEPFDGDFYPIEYRGGKLTGKIGEGNLFDGKYLHTKATGEKEYITFNKGKVVKTEPENGAIANNSSAENTNFPPIAEPKNGEQVLVDLFATFQKEIIENITKGTKIEKPTLELTGDDLYDFYKLPYKIFGSNEGNFIQHVTGIKHGSSKDLHDYHKAIFPLNDENTALQPDTMAVYLARNLGKDAGFNAYFKQLTPNKMVKNEFVETELKSYTFPSKVLASWVQTKPYQFPANISQSDATRKYLQTLYEKRYMHIDLVKSIQHLYGKSYYKLLLIIELREQVEKP